MKLRYLIPSSISLGLMLASCEGDKPESGETTTETAAAKTTDAPETDAKKMAEPEATEQSTDEAHQKVANDILALFMNTFEKLGNVADDDSADMAVAAIKDLPEKAEALVAKAEGMTAPTEETAKAIGKMADEKVKTMMMDNMTKMMENAAAAGEANMEKVNSAMNEVNDKMEALTKRLNALYPEPAEEGSEPDGM